jgi:LacI family transcriptional regulator
MSHIRTGRKAKERGVLALLVDVYSRQDWHKHESYRVYFQGVARRAEELGFHLESFFLTDANMSADKIDRILYARGIHGVILAPPYLGNKRLAMKWNRYSCVGTGYGWEQQQFDRVAHDHAQNVVLAFQRLSGLGYARIGMSIPSFYVKGRGARWLDGFLACQNRLPKERRVPLFVGSEEEGSSPEFQQWHSLHRPDVLLTLYGHEAKWLEALALRVPRDIGLACVIRPPGSALAGINDRYEEIGAATVELVASKIAFNQYGVPPYPKLILIEGHWVEGKSLRRVGRKLPLEF